MGSSKSRTILGFVPLNLWVLWRTDEEECLILPYQQVIKWANIWGVLGVNTVGACRQQIQSLGFQAFSLGTCYNIRGTTWKSLEEIKGFFCKKPGVERASHPPATSVVQPVLSEATFFELIFWTNIMMRWNYAKLINFIGLGLAWQVYMLPKFILFDVCLTWWGNPANSSPYLVCGCTDQSTEPAHQSFLT